MNIFNRDKKFTWIAIFYLCLIFIQSSIPSQYVPKMTILSYDKLIHAGIYFVAAILMYLALREHDYIKTNRTEWLALIFTVFFGCLLYTSPSPRDRTRSRMPSSA